MKKYSNFLIVILFLSNYIGISQKEKDIWIFGGQQENQNGNSSTAFEFQAGNGPTQLQGVGALNGTEGTAVVTDPHTGNVLFYTDGDILYNGSHEQIDPNTQIPGFQSLGASNTSTQPTVVCPVPICPVQNYYIFSNETGKAFSDLSVVGNISYRIYNPANQTFSVSQELTVSDPRVLDNNVDEGMTLIPNLGNSMAYWLIAKSANNQDLDGDGATEPTYLVWSINQSGIHFTGAQSVGDQRIPILAKNENAQHIMQATYSIEAVDDGVHAQVAWTYAEYAYWGGSRQNSLFTCDFNTITGKFDVGTSNVIMNNDNDKNSTLYDAEYSPNGKFLYYAYYANNEIYQYDVVNEIINPNPVFSNDILRGGGLEKGPDGMIYHIYDAGFETNSQKVGRITTPNMPFNNSPDFYEIDVIEHSGIRGYNLPEFIQLPQWEVKVSLEDTQICVGEETSLTADVISAGLNIDGYTWYKDDVQLDKTTGTIVIKEPGLYRVEVTVGGGCRIVSDEVDVLEKEDCCLAAGTPNATIYETNGQTISSDLVWDNKVYIADNVILTIKGATLDVTNVDVIFGNCAGINFEEGAILRTNNSVYRPCDYTATWRGLKFINNSTSPNQGVINECTFKNAKKAIQVTGSSGGFSGSYPFSGVRFTNNLFTNCKTGIDLSSLEMDKSISGNTFQIGEDVPQIFCASSNSNKYFGIKAKRMIFNNSVIGQNDFINNTIDELFIGIQISQSNDAFISENKFSRCSNGVSISSAAGMLIENNEFEVSYTTIAPGGQVTIDRASNCKVSSNEFFASAELNDNNYSPINLNNSSAISLVYTEGVSIVGNDIESFEAGIELVYNNEADIIENVIKNTWHYGIYSENIRSTNISCNDITMETSSGINSTGIGMIYSVFTNLSQWEFNTVRSNCVKEANHAIAVVGQGMGIGSTAPLIRNNFLYNYTINGVFLNNVNSSWAFGTQLTNQTASKNTFVSNNIAGGAVDINSTGNWPMVTVWGSSGISTTSPGVMLIGNGAFNSTASCGLQAGNTLNQLDASDFCKERLFNITPFSISNDEDAPVQFRRKSIENVEATEIIEVSELTISLYPNPTINEFTIELVNEDSDESEVEIYNSSGQSVFKKTILGNVVSENINISSLSSGYYIVKVEDALGNVKRDKLVVKK